MNRGWDREYTQYYNKYRCVIAWRELFTRETTEHEDKGEGEPFGHTLRAHSWDGVVCGGRFKRSLAEWIILFHGGANTSITATRILSGLRYESRIRRFVREEWKRGERGKGLEREDKANNLPALPCQTWNCSAILGRRKNRRCVEHGRAANPVCAAFPSPR